LLYPLSEISSKLHSLNVFRYITFRTIGAVLTAMLISFLLGPWLINWLRAKQIGQVVRDDGPQSHLSKKGTPTMGGVLIIAAIGLSTILWARLDNSYVWLALYVLVGFGAIGFLDDYVKLRRNRKGISSRQKMALQLFVGCATVVMFWYSRGIENA